jgi:hypothetical protein
VPEPKKEIFIKENTINRLDARQSRERENSCTGALIEAAMSSVFATLSDRSGPEAG